MKKTLLQLTATSGLLLAIIGGGSTLLSQATVQTIATDQGNTQSTTTSVGIISDFSPQAILVKTDNSAEPVHYTYTKSTTYVDENGGPVSMETVKSGLPVTVYYVKDGDAFVASKVIVRKAVLVPASTVQETKTTTTTTTDK